MLLFMSMNNAPIRWEPAIYEHKAALIGKSPGEVSRSADLLSRALVEEYKRYRADYMTVGIDVYNIEAESVGAVVCETDARSCPEIRTPPYSLESFDPTGIPVVSDSRFSLLIDAANIATKRIGEQTRLRIAASGPLTIASKLIGIESVVIALAMEDRRVTGVLEYCESLCDAWLHRIREAGFDAILFDSTAAPPVISPKMYIETIGPIHCRLMKLLESLGQHDRPLIIGGDTVPIAKAIADTGASTMICDFRADARRFCDGLGVAHLDRISVRRNIDPAHFIPSAGTFDNEAAEYAVELGLFPKPIAGTGIIPYDADPERYLTFQSMVLDRLRS